MNILIIDHVDKWPTWLPFEDFVDFLNKNMVPYEDSPEDIKKGLKYALSEKEDKGGTIILAENDKNLIGAVVLLQTGMSGYVPENMVLFACVPPDHRGQGIGGRLLEYAITHVDGDIKLHVEYDNPAKRLYERLGFTNKYAEMRYTAKKS